MLVIAHAGHLDDFLVGVMVGAILSVAFLLLGFVSRRI